MRIRFEDEARFGRHGTLARVWARRGSRPCGTRQNRYTCLCVIMAACVGTGAASGLVSPTLDAGVIDLSLERRSRELPSGAHAVLVWDGAGYHTGNDLVVPDNMSLIQPVPYPPELIPVENFWLYQRSHYWSLRVSRGYEELEEAAMAAWRAVCLEPGSVRSICAAPYVSGYA